MPNTNKPDTSKVLPKPGPDPSEKLLEDYADVFSDIVNVLVYQGESVVKPENLRDGPTASMYKTIYGRLRQKNRDVLKFDTEHDVEVRVYGLENQSKSSNIMPVRVMGYDFSSYDRDILRKKAENKAAGHEADYAAELWPEQKLCPVVTLVLYFGAEPWSGPTSLVDMLNLPDNLKGYVSDYHINLVQVAFLEDEVISKFQSDFQIVAEFFKAKRLGNVKKLKYNTRKWNHVAELLDFFQTFVGFKHYQEIRQDIIEQSRKEDIVMDSVFYSIFDEAWDKGIEKGISALTETYQELHRTKEELQAKLVEKFELTEEQAKGYIQQYWI